MTTEHSKKQTPQDDITLSNDTPVAWISKQSLAVIGDFDATVYGRGGFDDATPLYTKPVHREWIGLTQAEIRDIRKRNQSHDAYAHAIINKLREKNT